MCSHHRNVSQTLYLHTFFVFSLLALTSESREQMNATDIRKRVRELGDPEDARFLQGYFKTGPGEYGEGDVFLGIRVPVIRKLVKEFKDVPLRSAAALLKSPAHEERLLALLILVRKYEKGTESDRKVVYGLYMDNTRYINNWDLVDLSAPNIVGAHLSHRSRKPLDKLARSRLLWNRRIAILATFSFIKAGESDPTFRIAEMLIEDQEDLIHKAVGWMLREVGKRDMTAEEAFLDLHCRRMPSTMLRYAIERFPEKKRQRYLKGLVSQ
jgi:3-methyladenine DNA glycosylase AlkD